MIQNCTNNCILLKVTQSVFTFISIPSKQFLLDKIWATAVVNYFFSKRPILYIYTTLTILSVRLFHARTSSRFFVCRELFKSALWNTWSGRSGFFELARIWFWFSFSAARVCVYNIPSALRVARRGQLTRAWERSALINSAPSWPQPRSMEVLWYCMRGRALRCDFSLRKSHKRSRFQAFRLRIWPGTSRKFANCRPTGWKTVLRKWSATICCESNAKSRSPWRGARVVWWAPLLIANTRFSFCSSWKVHCYIDSLNKP